MPGTSESIKASWANPEQREKRLAGLRAARNCPEKEAKRINALRSAMKREDVIAKMSKINGSVELINRRYKTRYGVDRIVDGASTTKDGPWFFGRPLTREEKNFVHKCRQAGLSFDAVAKELNKEKSK